MKLWHCADARSFRALWTLEELRLDYDLELLPFPPRFLQPSYLEINPLGTIPLLEDGDARLTESAAIIEYLATKYGPSPLAVRPDEPDYGAWLNWLHHGEATLTFPQTLVLRYSRLEPEERRQPTVAADYARWFAKRTLLAQAALEKSDWLCAGRFTGADISVGYAFVLAETLGLMESLPAVLNDYLGRLKTRPGFERAKAMQKGQRLI